MEIKGYLFCRAVTKLLFSWLPINVRAKTVLPSWCVQSGSHRSCSRCGKFKITLNCVWLGRCGRCSCKAPSVMFHWKSWTFPKNSPHISVSTPPPLRKYLCPGSFLQPWKIEHKACSNFIFFWGGDMESKKLATLSPSVQLAGHVVAPGRDFEIVSRLEIVPDEAKIWIVWVWLLQKPTFCFI